MATRAQKVRLSIFLIISSAVLLTFFVVLVGTRLLSPMDPYHIIYEGFSITGLEPGAAVKYNGVQIGRVTDLSVVDAASIRVDIQVERGSPIKTDTRAVVTAIGITGLKYIELSGGTVDSDNLEPGSRISAGESFLDAISGKAEVIMAKLEQVLNNLNHMIGPGTTDSINKALLSVANVSGRVDSLLSLNQSAITNSITNMDSIMADLAISAENTARMTAAVNDMLQSRDIQETMSNVRAISASVRGELDSLRLAETTAELRSLMKNTDKLVVHMDLLTLQSRDDILRSLSSLEEALENLREAAEVIKENPSVLLRGRQQTGDRME